jgi:hypothetical protein
MKWGRTLKNEVANNEVPIEFVKWYSFAADINERRALRLFKGRAEQERKRRSSSRQDLRAELQHGIVSS